jgi:hypothetical protein
MSLKDNVRLGWVAARSLIFLGFVKADAEGAIAHIVVYNDIVIGLGHQAGFDIGLRGK